VVKIATFAKPETVGRYAFETTSLKSNLSIRQNITGNAENRLE